MSPTFTFTSSTVPSEGEGTSMLALSDSSTISGCSGSTASPALTSTSMTGTSAKSPRSGTTDLAQRVHGGAASGSMS